jgi:uncharacterized protein YceK
MKSLKSFLPFVSVIALLTWGGCASRSTLEKRKQERYGAYTSLRQDWRALVDEGKLAVGMPMDAVYIAWGKPAQVTAGESPQGAYVVWLYHDVYLQDYRYWTYREYHHHRGVYGSPYLVYDYQPRSYVRAEVVFEKGLVTEWRLNPTPLGN